MAMRRWGQKIIHRVYFHIQYISTTY